MQRTRHQGRAGVVAPAEVAPRWGGGGHLLEFGSRFEFGRRVQLRLASSQACVRGAPWHSRVRRRRQPRIGSLNRPSPPASLVSRRNPCGGQVEPRHASSIRLRRSRAVSGGRSPGRRGGRRCTWRRRRVRRGRVSSPWGRAGRGRRSIVRWSECRAVRLSSRAPSG